MPPNCNGLALIDERSDFCKLNCQWVKKNVGRPALPKKDVKKDVKRGKVKNPKSICLVLEKDLVDFIKNQALQRSVQEGIYIEPNELIREALLKAFPTPKQCDMFGGSR